jgi:hypothetical protein
VRAPISGLGPAFLRGDWPVVAHALQVQSRGYGRRGEVVARVARDRELRDDMSTQWDRIGRGGSGGRSGLGDAACSLGWGAGGGEWMTLWDLRQ